ncbi:MAG: 3-methyl-2-oxobutanoate hydroxymethyltransferase [Alphaproteobacteria bacterium MarineAlpha6_Bin2]|nr:MAG: 3-methyl-2-oxobutanoate hydroxymethyltransferase [Alphaproteobacteria bacterium MarineAlpha6_Bin2]
MSILHKKKITIKDFKQNLFSQPIVGLTAYSKNMAEIIDHYVDFILVGDSLGITLYGMKNTRSVNLQMMINHGKSVVKGTKRSLVIVDLPFGTYQQSPKQAYKTASIVIKETGCDAIKIEGGKEMAKTIDFLNNRDIPVMGHIGFLPQTVNNFNNISIKGFTKEEENSLVLDAEEIEKAGAFAIVIEAVAKDAAKKITSKISIPTIGIGASVECNGQILVTDDMLGLTYSLNKSKILKKPKFVKEYNKFSHNFFESAIEDFSKDVRSKKFPTDEYSYSANTKNIKFLNLKKR